MYSSRQRKASAKALANGSDAVFVVILTALTIFAVMINL